MTSQLSNLSVENNYEKLNVHSKSINKFLKTSNSNNSINNNSNSNTNGNNTNGNSLLINEINNNDSKDLNSSIDSIKNVNETTANLNNIKESSNSTSDDDQKRVHRVVFTGGPCAGKTTSINRIKNFFENIGWRVFCVPETATTLLSSGIYFSELNQDAKINFQENLLKTLLQIEDTINETAKYYASARNQNVMIIYDRGAMDPVAYIDQIDWDLLKLRNPNWNEVDLRDNRYDQIIHLVTAANGAEQFYSLENNVARTESIDLARELDEKCAKVWVGHPNMDVIGNCLVFDNKVTKALQAVCERVGLNLKGFDAGNKKRKFLLNKLPDDSKFRSFQELTVIHNYLVSTSDSVQVRIRKSGQGGNWSYSYAIRTFEPDGQTIETRTQVDRREYAILSKTIDQNHWTIYQRRRCFIWKHRYYRLDIYEEPCNPSCRGLVILSTRTADDNLKLPDFLDIEKEITKDPKYSMFNLSIKNI